MKLDQPVRVPLRLCRIGKRKTTVTAETRQMLIEEQHYPSFPRIGYRSVVTAVVIAIVSERAEMTLLSKLAIAFVTLTIVNASASSVKARLNSS